ncbi:hypothetical protein DFH06DRAFT_1134111 [Mycena polygramma]|nr:hypothetical protein DFH06DRAFT_1134111 [Mycena polygramma]
MSFVQDETCVLACDLWDEEFCFTKELGIPNDTSRMHSSDLVPPTIEGVDDWAYVGLNSASHDSSRPHAFFYRHVPPSMHGNLECLVLQFESVRKLGRGTGTVHSHYPDFELDGGWRGVDSANEHHRKYTLRHSQQPLARQQQKRVLRPTRDEA